MYGGGVAGGYQNEAFDAGYKTASSNVKETTISLINGSLNGDVYAGGFNIKDSTFLSRLLTLRLLKLAPTSSSSRLMPSSTVPALIRQHSTS